MLIRLLDQKNKCISSMSCRKISRIINTVFLKKNIRYKGKQLKISFKTISNYLSEKDNESLIHK